MSKFNNDLAQAVVQLAGSILQVDVAANSLNLALVLIGKRGRPKTAQLIELVIHETGPSFTTPGWPENREAAEVCLALALEECRHKILKLDSLIVAPGGLQVLEQAIEETTAARGLSDDEAAYPIFKLLARRVVLLLQRLALDDRQLLVAATQELIQIHTDHERRIRQMESTIWPELPVIATGASSILSLRSIDETPHELLGLNPATRDGVPYIRRDRHQNAKPGSRVTSYLSLVPPWQGKRVSLLN